MKIKITLFAVLFCCLGCGDLFENTIFLDEVELPEQLAITAKIDQLDSVQSIFVSHTLPTSSQEDYQIYEDAEVTLKVAGREKQGIFYEDTQLYQFDFSPEELFTGEDVRLVVSHPDYGIATANQSLALNNLEIDVDRSGVIFMDSLIADSGTVSISFRDNATQTNYYYITGEATGEFYDPFQQTTERGTKTMFINSQEVFIEFTTGRILFFKDESLNGEVVHFKFQYNSSLAEITQLKFRLYSTTQADYVYEIASSRSAQSQNSLLVEPVIVPSNIENGVGIFALREVVEIDIIP